VSLTFVHILDVVLFSLMQGEETVKGSAKTFLPWLFDAIIDPRCDAFLTKKAPQLANQFYRCCCVYTPSRAGPERKGLCALAHAAAGVPSPWLSFSPEMVCRLIDLCTTAPSLGKVSFFIGERS
jgi:hypothetical protein